MGYEDTAVDILEDIRRERRRVEEAVARGETPRKCPRWPARIKSVEDYLAHLASRDETEQRHRDEAAADERAGRIKARPEWLMVAAPVVGDFVYADDYSLPIYRGFPDTGYHIIFPRMRSRKGKPIGRRSLYPADHSVPGWLAEIHGTGRRDVLGQRFAPPARIWCPISSCGALNAVDWPAPLQGPEAR
jgi:hypothetical protein